MAQDRPDIPTALKRAVLVEAGHRCAIPTCRQTPVELAHITPWNKVKEHTFGNLIALCPTCHTRFDRGDIDRRSMLQYKSNLEVLNGRYTDTERQILKVYAKRWSELDEEHGDGKSFIAEFRRLLKGGGIGFGDITIHEGMWWMLSNLLDDGILELHHSYEAAKEGRLSRSSVSLTPKGFELIERMVHAEPI
ncbi:HNH endonuclease [Streptomyces sp. NPDC094437]|uniref:HNH endonuclease n=1 Tax=Streptomyces sp. NPDC094437 TaxID=3366060 RepID=UPI00380E6A8B